MSWDDFREDVLKGLWAVPSLSCTAMGAGHGLKSGDVFFGIIERGRLYFRVDDASRPAYEAEGSGPFRVKGGLMEAYYEVPFDVREDPALFLEWANRSVACARRASAGPSGL